MREDSFLISRKLCDFAMLGAAVILAVGLSAPAEAQTEKILLSFSGARGGSHPEAGLSWGPDGSLYGTTEEGGDPSCRIGLTPCGIVFKLTPIASGGWAETVIHAFTGGWDGSLPKAGVIVDGAGNVYGTTSYGGSFTNNCESYACGTVFELSPTSNGGWRETVLHNFSNGVDGGSPEGDLVFDAAGNLYGTAYAGGRDSTAGGVVFRLSRTSTGGWTETVLHSFNTVDGAGPYGALTLDAVGNLYGVTQGGGDPNVCADCGVVFQLVPTSGGWKENVLHYFSGGLDGLWPFGGVVLDTAGNLYGTTVYGGNTGCSTTAQGCGVVFELSPLSNGMWQKSALYVFSGLDGAHPAAPVVLDSAGNLYGTTSEGDGHISDCFGVGCGLVFELSPTSNGVWTETVLHPFRAGNDGEIPAYGAGLVLDAAGNLYGTTWGGGVSGSGVVYEIMP